MIKLSRFFKHFPAIDAAEFSRRWLADYGPRMQRLAAASAGVSRYAQSHAVAHDSPIANAPVSPFDGVDELWCESLDQAAALFDSDTYREQIAPAEAGLIDPDRSVVVVGTVRVMWERPSQPQADAVKLVIMPARKPGLSVAAFRHHWIEVHSPLSLAGPDMRAHVQRVEFCPSAGIGIAGLPAAACEGTGSIWFDSLRHLQAEFGSDYYRSTLQPDEQRFSDPERSRGSMVHERLVWQRTD